MKDDTPTVTPSPAEPPTPAELVRQLEAERERLLAQLNFTTGQLVTAKAWAAAEQKPAD